jgi:hypothetical protein
MENNDSLVTWRGPRLLDGGDAAQQRRAPAGVERAAARQEAVQRAARRHPRLVDAQQLPQRPLRSRQSVMAGSHDCRSKWSAPMTSGQSSPMTSSQDCSNGKD